MLNIWCFQYIRIHVNILKYHISFISESWTRNPGNLSQERGGEKSREDKSRALYTPSD